MKRTDKSTPYLVGVYICKAIPNFVLSKLLLPLSPNCNLQLFDEIICQIGSIRSLGTTARSWKLRGFFNYDKYIPKERVGRAVRYVGRNHSTGKGWSVGWGSIFDPFLNEWSVNRLFCSSQFRSRRSCRFFGSFARKGCAYNQAIRSLSQNQLLMEKQLLARKSEPKICVFSCLFS